MSHFNAINKSIIYAMSQIELKILGKFSKHSVGSLIYRLQKGTIGVSLYIDVDCSR